MSTVFSYYVIFGLGPLYYTLVFETGGSNELICQRIKEKSVAAEVKKMNRKKRQELQKSNKSQTFSNYKKIRFSCWCD